jgi:hypothetical protein
MQWPEMIDFPIDWQTCVALLIVGGAVLALLRRFLGVSRKSGLSCSSCSSCVNSDPGTSIREIELLQLEKTSAK